MTMLNGLVASFSTLVVSGLTLASSFAWRDTWNMYIEQRVPDADDAKNPEDMQRLRRRFRIQLNIALLTTLFTALVYNMVSSAMGDNSVSKNVVP